MPILSLVSVPVRASCKRGGEGDKRTRRGRTGNALSYLSFGGAYGKTFIREASLRERGTAECEGGKEGGTGKQRNGIVEVA